MAKFARDRANIPGTFAVDTQDEKKLFLRILATFFVIFCFFLFFLFFFLVFLMVLGILGKIPECILRFSREAKEYARQHGFVVQASIDALLM